MGSASKKLDLPLELVPTNRFKFPSLRSTLSKLLKPSILIRVIKSWPLSKLSPYCWRIDPTDNSSQIPIVHVLTRIRHHPNNRVHTQSLRVLVLRGWGLSLAPFLISIFQLAAAEQRVTFAPTWHRLFVVCLCEADSCRPENEQNQRKRQKGRAEARPYNSRGKCLRVREWLPHRSGDWRPKA